MWRLDRKLFSYVAYGSRLNEPFSLMSRDEDSNQNIELTRLRYPVLLRGAVERHCTAVKREMDILGLSRCQIDSAKAFQFPDGAIHARVSVVHVELDHFRAWA